MTVLIQIFDYTILFYSFHLKLSRIFKGYTISFLNDHFKEFTAILVKLISRKAVGILQHFYVLNFNNNSNKIYQTYQIFKISLFNDSKNDDDNGNPNCELHFLSFNGLSSVALRNGGIKWRGCYQTFVLSIFGTSS